MNLLQIQYFVSVAKNLSFTVASQELYVSQPSISKQVAALEDELGLDLFVRSGKALSLTRAGEILYRDCQTVLADVDVISQHANDFNTSVRGKLRIGVMCYMDISRVAGGSIGRFHQQYPDVDIEFSTLGFDNILSDFLEDRIDCAFLLAFTANQLSGSFPIHRKMVYNGPHRIVYPSSYKAKFNKEHPTPADFADFPYIIISARRREQTPEMEETALQYVFNYGFVPKKVIWVDSVDALLLSVESGLGIGVVGPTARLPKNKYIAYTNLDRYDPGSAVYFCWPQESTNPQITQYLDFLSPLFIE